MNLVQNLLRSRGTRDGELNEGETHEKPIQTIDPLVRDRS